MNEELPTRTQSHRDTECHKEGGAPELNCQSLVVIQNNPREISAIFLGYARPVDERVWQHRHHLCSYRSEGSMPTGTGDISPSNTGSHPATVSIDELVRVTLAHRERGYKGREADEGCRRPQFQEHRSIRQLCPEQASSYWGAFICLVAGGRHYERELEGLAGRESKVRAPRA